MAKKSAGAASKSPCDEPQRVNSRGAAKWDPLHIINDVFDRPSVGASSGWIVGLLFALVVWLTWKYAPGAAIRAAQGEGAASATEGTIPIIAGYWTVGAVAVLAVLAGLEPIIGPPLALRWDEVRRRLVLRVPDIARLSRRNLGLTGWLEWRLRWLAIDILNGLGTILGLALLLIWRAPSCVISFFDWLLARPIAFAAGTAFQLWWLRYGWLLVVIGVCAWLGWSLPAPRGLYWGILPGIIAIFAVVRRWNWIESDREAFMTARGTNPDIERIGFAEDLRDEALIAIVFLFALIPLGLRQVDLAFGAFDLVQGEMPADALGQFFTWLGFFGAELAKAVPLVDWSEVFHVANGSPIQAKTALGAQIVFGMRASLDLLLIAAVVQAVQIAGRLHAQYLAFWAKPKNLPILDPFAERREFRKLAAQLAPHPHVPLIKQPAIEDFPAYDVGQLVEIVCGDGQRRQNRRQIMRDSSAREACAIVLAKQYGGKETAAVLGYRMENVDDEKVRGAALRLFVENDPAGAAEPLAKLVVDASAPTALRETAARELGWLRASGAADVLLNCLSTARTPREVQAQAGLALVKLGVGDAQRHLETLARSFQGGISGDGLIPVMSTAYALARLGKAQNVGVELLAGLFAEPLKPHATRAIRSALGELDKVKSLEAGSYEMGAADGERDAVPFERPHHPVSVRAFELGIYPVTFEEYDSFATGEAHIDLPEEWEKERLKLPVTLVTWHDAHRYCDWLNSFTGERFRLPSEAEWEFACRAGEPGPYSFGSDVSQLDKYAWYEGNSESRPHAVGGLERNKFDLYDMHGNVWEWCQDAWNRNYEQPGRPNDGSAWLRSETQFRVLRGGSWNYSPRHLRSANRYRDLPSHRNYLIGFRLARTVSPPASLTS